MSKAYEFNQSNCITVQKARIKDLEKENEQLKCKYQKIDDKLYSKECDIFDLKKKNEQLQESLVIANASLINFNELKKENEQLKQSISHYANIAACSVEVMNEDDELKNDYASILCTEMEKVVKENEQLKQREKTLEGMIRTFDEGCKEIYDDKCRLEKENEQLKKQLRDKECEWLRNNTVWEQMPSSRKSVTKTSLRPKPTKKGGCGVSKQDLNIKVRDDGVYILETEKYRFHLDEKTHVEKMGRLINENEQLKLDNKRLLSDYTDVCNDNIAVVDENEQLKQTNQRLNDELQECMGKLALKR